MQRIKPGIPSYTNFARALFSRLIPVASDLKNSQLHRLHGLQLVIRSHGFPNAIEILEVEEFYRKRHEAGCGVQKVICININFRYWYKSSPLKERTIPKPRTRYKLSLFQTYDIARRCFLTNTSPQLLLGKAQDFIALCLLTNESDAALVMLAGLVVGGVA
ncbi:MAG: hypothetical protein PUP93_08275 [Rhizonema sp. NSF051]|nr:hypothetical protein [Rhizonema sp. NSF051]